MKITKNIIKKVIIAGVIILLVITFGWITWMPEWGAFGVTINEPLTGFEYYINTQADKVGIVGVINDHSVKDGCLEIPDSFWGKPVTSVSVSGMIGHTSIIKVKLPECVEYVGSLPFLNLQEVIGGEGIIAIGSDAFAGCTKLNRIELGDEVESIGAWAFMNCTSLEEIELGNKVETIMDGAFCGCTSLKEIKLGDSVKTVGYRAFKDCTSLEKVELGDNIKKVGEEAFKNTPWADTTEGWEFFSTMEIE